jgi:hypothetical protein
MRALKIALITIVAAVLVIVAAASVLFATLSETATAASPPICSSARPGAR